MKFQYNSSQQFTWIRKFHQNCTKQRESLFATVRGDRYQQVSETYTNGIFAHAMRIEERLVKLNETWPVIVDKIVKDTVVGLDSVAMFASIQ